MWSSSVILFLLLGALPVTVLGDNILQTSSFTTCSGNPAITVQTVDIQYNNDNKTVSFNVAGSSASSINVTAILNVTAYGNSVYSNTFNPCHATTFVQQLCPVPAGSFSATGTQAIPAQYASLIPAIAFQIPDIAAQATLQLKALDTGEDVACIQSQVTNGKTVDVPAVSYVAVSMAGAAVVLTSASSLVGVMSAGGGAHSGGSGTVSPSFMEVFGWFQGLAMNGMLSVNYPPVYRSFTKNFAFSTGLIPWDAIQTSIDNFRAVTGGNLTDNNVQFLRNNATLVNTDGTPVSNTSAIIKRVIEAHLLKGRQITTSINGSTDASSNSILSKIEVEVSGIAAYVEQLAIPNGNTFMTALLVVAIIIAAIVVFVLLLKAILETWALVGNFPKSLSGFRRHYWGTMARSIVQLILMAYGILVLYSVYQFTNGDSWAAKGLAAAVLVVFTGVLAFFTFKIWLAAKQSKQTEGDVSLLYEDKETWMKYSLFYDSYKKDWWWTFIPAISYMIAKGTVVAAADGHGLAQTIAQLVIETLMLGLLIFTRPYVRKSGNVINIIIQVVRALSVVCILVFVEELGIAQTTQTVTGVVLIAIQSALTGALAILILVNAVIICFKANPHRKRRKEAEKLNRDLDNLTPLHAHNSILLYPAKTGDSEEIPHIDFDRLSTTKSRDGGMGYSDPSLPLLRSPINPVGTFDYSQEKANPYGDSLTASTPAPMGYPFTKANTYQNIMQPPQQERSFGDYRPGQQNIRSQDSTERMNLVSGAAPVGIASGSPPRGYGGQQPTVPDLGGYRGMGYR